MASQSGARRMGKARRLPVFRNEGNRFMRITKLLGVTTAVLLVPVALAAAAASGVYSGTLKFNDGYRNNTFALKATFKSGRLTRLYGEGTEIPFKKKLSNSEACGGANLYDSSDAGDQGKYPATISGSTDKTGGFSFVLRGKFHDVTTFEGKFVSASKLTGKIRFYEAHLPRFANGKATPTGHCDSGFLPVTLSSK